MASYHLSVKVGKVGNALRHADYICRDGQYKNKRDEDLEYSEYGNLPHWAKTAREFWQSSDHNERSNGSVYREFEIALPRELTKAQRLELVQAFVRNEIGDKKPYTFAIHNPRAAIDGGEQPHAHIMYSERIQDGIKRSSDQYFKRYNTKHPEKGGCKKDNLPMKSAERKQALIKLRERFATLQNCYLEKHGHDAKVTHLSLVDQGKKRKPEPHLGPKIAKLIADDVRAQRLYEAKYGKLMRNLQECERIINLYNQAIEKAEKEHNHKGRQAERYLEYYHPQLRESYLKAIDFLEKNKNPKQDASGEEAPEAVKQRQSNGSKPRMR